MNGYQIQSRDSVNVADIRVSLHTCKRYCQLAPILVGAGLDIAWLDNIAQKVPSDALSGALAWLTTSLTGVGVLNEIEHCSERISQLVQAVKDYSYMDRAPLQDVDVHQVLESTLTMLTHKLKRGTTVIRHQLQFRPR